MPESCPSSTWRIRSHGHGRNCPSCEPHFKHRPQNPRYCFSIVSGRDKAMRSYCYCDYFCSYSLSSVRHGRASGVVCGVNRSEKAGEPAAVSLEHVLAGIQMIPGHFI